MTTKQVEPDEDAWREQEGRQRRSTKNKRIGAFAVAAAIGVAAVGLVLVNRPGPSTRTPATQPSAPTPSRTVPQMAVPSFLDLRTGAATPLAEGIPTTGRAYAVSPDGTMVASNPCCHPPVPVWVANMDGTGVREITPEGVDGFWPRWSPDGSMLVYSERDATITELGNLVVVDVATGERTQVTDLEPKSYDTWFLGPTFSPDGRSILFELPRGPGSEPEGYDLWSVPVEGGEPTLVLRDASAASYSPDGRSLAYVDPSGALIVAHADGTNPRVVVESDVGNPRWSPDGTRIAYLDGVGVYVVDVATGETSLVARGDWPEWFDNDTLIVSPA